MIIHSIDIYVYRNFSSNLVTLKECVEELLGFLKALQGYKPEFFGPWYYASKSKKESMKYQMELTYEGVRKLFPKRAKEDDLGNFARDVGFHVGAWSGSANDLEAYSFSAYWSTSKLFRNNCSLSLANAGPQFEYYEHKEHQKELGKFMKNYWKADECRVMNRHYSTIEKRRVKDTTDRY